MKKILRVLLSKKLTSFARKITSSKKVRITVKKNSIPNGSILIGIERLGPNANIGYSFPANKWDKLTMEHVKYLLQQHTGATK